MSSPVAERRRRHPRPEAPPAIRWGHAPRSSTPPGCTITATRSSSPTCAGTSTAAPAGTRTTAGHLPGAVFVDLDDWLAAPATPRRAAPSAAGSGGLRRGDGAGSASATTTRSSPTTTPAASWPPGWSGCCGRPATTPPCSTAASPRGTGRSRPGRRPGRPRPSPRPVAGGPVRRRRRRRRPGANVVIDARTRERYRGETEPVDPRARAHPGRAQPAGPREPRPPTAAFCPADELRARFEAAGVDRRRAGGLLLRLGRHAPATTCSPWSAPAWAAGGCSPGPGRSGAPTSAARSRPATTDAGQAADRSGAPDAKPRRRDR